MKKTVQYKIRGRRADIGKFTILRMLPNPYAYHVGHFVFLDYAPHTQLLEKDLHPEAAHPHRGIATLTYLMNGEMDHYDSRGNRGTVYSGGVQWMKAGNGIIHNESPGPDTLSGGNLGQLMQFWINLPAAQKREEPEYMALQANSLPLLPLPEDAGTLKVVVGEYGGARSTIPTYSQLFLYHIRLEPGKEFTLSCTPGHEYAVFLPHQDQTVNGEAFHAGDLVALGETGDEISLFNPLESVADIVLFGGEPYTEPFVAQGPYVMNTRAEIQQAHVDYMNGKYGVIRYT